MLSTRVCHLVCAEADTYLGDMGSTDVDGANANGSAR
jgi:hypothetical protein